MMGTPRKRPRSKFEVRRPSGVKTKRSKSSALYGRTSEWKAIRTEITTQNMIPAGSVVDVSAIAQGNTRSTRSGQNVRVGNIRLAYRMHFLNAAEYVTTRVVLFQWLGKDDFAGLSAAAILENTGATHGSICGYSMENRGEYKILYDRSHDFKLDVTAKDQYKTVIAKVPTKVKEILFKGTNSDQGSGKIGMVFLSSESTYYPTITAEVQVNFQEE